MEHTCVQSIDVSVAMPPRSPSLMHVLTWLGTTSSLRLFECLSRKKVDYDIQMLTDPVDSTVLQTCFLKAQTVWDDIQWEYAPRHANF